MALRVWLTSSALLLLSTAAAFGQQADVAPSIVQPGAPGEGSRVLSTAEAMKAMAPRTPGKADVDFMQGMIMHHGQAVEMTKMLLTRTKNKDLYALGDRISISQTDEMKWMKQWLTDRGQSESMDMSHMDHSKMDMSAMMPGMLTTKQMHELEQAKGAQFDHLFLTGMIQHHKGALTMVQDLFDTPGAGQDAVLFDFATDVDNTQSAEIRIMQGMLSHGNQTKEKR